MDRERPAVALAWYLGKVFILLSLSFLTCEMGLIRLVTVVCSDSTKYFENSCLNKECMYVII